MGRSLSSYLVSCINIQIGRDPPFLQSLVKSLFSRKYPDLYILRLFVDPVYNRSSITICGVPSSLVEATVDLSKSVLGYETHKHNYALMQTAPEFQHNHCGILDMIPVAPLITEARFIEQHGSNELFLKEASETARKIGVEIEKESKTNRVLYFGGAAEDWESLSSVRKKKTNFFKVRESQYSEKQDMLTLVGAANYVLNYNIVMDTMNLGAAKHIAKQLRTRSWSVGYEGLKARGDPIELMTFPHEAHDGKKVCEIACNVNQSSDDYDIHFRIGSALDEIRSSICQQHRMNDDLKPLYAYCTNLTLKEVREKFQTISVEKDYGCYSFEDIELRNPPGQLLNGYQQVKCLTWS